MDWSLRGISVGTIALLCAFLFLLCACASAGLPPAALQVVPKVDLGRYAGRWYEIASFPQIFQRGCTDSRADYRLRGDGTVEVLNSCLRDGRVDTAKGKAWVVDAATGAKLKVSFFWPFRGDYWIIELGGDYEYAVVSAPSMKYLWILSRTPQMDEQRYQAIVVRLKDRGFDVAKLNRTPQGNRKD
jgi:apolipoprotein D and lipocalin family protein